MSLQAASEFSYVTCWKGNASLLKVVENKLPRSISIGRAAFVPCPGAARLRLGRGSEPAVMEAKSLRVVSRIGPEQ